MLPRETSVRQLKKLRAETKGKDIGDLTVNDRLNKNLPNLQYIGNPVDIGIESWEEFSKKDSQLQTVAFKSKLVNKPLVKENNTKNMKNNKIVKINEFLDIEDEKMELINLILDQTSEYSIDELNNMKFDELQNILDNMNNFDEEPELNVDNIKSFEAFKLFEPKPKKNDQPEYTMLGKEKELESNPNFGIGAVKDKEIKKIAFFNNFTHDTNVNRERQILNAGQYIDNGIVKGHINKIVGKDVYVELSDEPMTIKKFNIKDVVKTKKEE